MKNRAHDLERRLDQIKRRIVAVGDLQPGSLSEQYKLCGKPGCRCTASPPKRHGPYYQLSFTRRGRSGTRFVRREDLGAIKTQIKNYSLFRKLVDEWIDLSTELSNLKIATRHIQRG